MTNMAKDKQTLAQRNNFIRASVMGANDGILSVSGIVIGVAGATTVAVVLAGYLSALIGKGFASRTVKRNVIVGLLTIAIHYTIGLFF